MIRVVEKEICPRCERIGSLTKDHIIPKVFVRQLRRFGIELPKGYVNIERVCGGCNWEKDNVLDLGDPITYEAARQLRTKLWEMEMRGEEIQWGKLEQYRDVINSLPVLPPGDGV